MTKDVYVVTRGPDQVTSIDVFAFGTDTRTPATGFYKTLLQWLKCFFTEQGTDIGDLSYGTGFASLIGGSASEADLRDAALLSVRQATKTIQSYQRRGTVPADERLAAATLASLNVDQDSVTLYVTMVSGTGESLELAVPTQTPSFKF